MSCALSATAQVWGYALDYKEARKCHIGCKVLKALKKRLGTKRVEMEVQAGVMEEEEEQRLEIIKKDEI